MLIYGRAREGLSIFAGTYNKPILNYNPDWYLNQDFKQSVNKYEIPTNLKRLRSNTDKVMLSLQNNPQKVANFFKHPKVCHAG